MALFNAAMFNEEGLEQNVDSLGGSFTVPTGEYTALIKSNYLGESQGGAISFTIVAQLTSKENETSEYRETFFITNKEKQNFYTDSNGKKLMLPGCRTVNDLCLIACGKGLSGVSTEERVVSAFSPEKKEVVPMTKEVISELMGLECKLLITEEIRNKQVRDAMGKYVDTADKVSRNVVTKVLNSNGLTALEIEKVKNGEEIKESYRLKWLEKNEGKPHNRYKAVAATEPLGESAKDISTVGDMLRL